MVIRTKKMLPLSNTGATPRQGCFPERILQPFRNCKRLWSPSCLRQVLWRRILSPVLPALFGASVTLLHFELRRLNETGLLLIPMRQKKCIEL